MIPLTSTEHVMETLLGVANHTPSSISYECLLAASLSPEEMESLNAIAAGDIRVIPSTEPGIAQLCNAAAREGRGRYLCILQPGIVPQPGWLEAMLESMKENDGPGIVGGRIVYPNALLAHAGIALDGNFTPTRIYKMLPGDFPGACKPRRMRAVSDCMLVRRDCWESVGGMDEALEGDLSDIDFCLQADAAGWRIVYEPRSVLVSIAEPQKKSDPDRLWFYGKWTGNLWPDEERYWQEDGVTQEKLLEYYRQIRGPETAIAAQASVQAADA